MHFDHQPVCTGCCGSFCQWLYVGPDAGGMAGIYDHRKVAFCTDHRNRTDIKGVSGGGFVGADAAFAQDDVGIAF